MNRPILGSRSNRFLKGLLSAAMASLLGGYAQPVEAQQRREVTPAPYSAPQSYVDPSYVQPVQLPTTQQYYEYLPNRERRIGESPLDNFLKQTANQMYTRFDYMNFTYSKPGPGIVGGPGKRLSEGYGFQEPAYIDGARFLFANGTDVPPLRFERLNTVEDLVLIQVWESDPDELIDQDADGLYIDIIDGNQDGDFDDTDDPDPTMRDFVDDNDLDIFPRVINTRKDDYLSGDPSVVDDIILTTGVDGLRNLSQVAVLAVGRLANTKNMDFDNSNGFRGTVGLRTNFGALEAEFLTLDKATSRFEFTPVLPGLLAPITPGGLGAAIDPLVIPVLVNDMIAPDITNDINDTPNDPSDDLLITDSNNYYIVFNDTYNLVLETEAWGFSPSVYWTLNERPGRFKVSASAGMRYFNYQERMGQRGTFTTITDRGDFLRPDFNYTSELEDEQVNLGTVTNNPLDDPNSPVDPDLENPNVAGIEDTLVSTIISDADNRMIGPQAGIRFEFGDERVAFGWDSKVMLGVNNSESTVLVDDLLYVGDDNFTRQNDTDFSAGFDTLIDAKIRLRENVHFTIGYNFLWFSHVSRAHDNVYYNIDAQLIPAADRNPDGTGPDYTYQNDVVVSPKKQSAYMNGITGGLIINW